jgi:hypothetical protein
MTAPQNTKDKYRGNKAEGTPPELLDFLKSKAGCTYISDLRFIDPEELLFAVSEIPAQTYSISEWADASNYLTYADKQFKNADEAKEYIVSCLKKEKYK